MNMTDNLKKDEFFTNYFSCIDIYILNAQIFSENI